MLLDEMNAFFQEMMSSRLEMKMPDIQRLFTYFLRTDFINFESNCSMELSLATLELKS